MIERIDRWCVEMNRSPSATRNECERHDREIWRAIFDDLRRWYEADLTDEGLPRSELYLPKYHPHALDIPEQPALIEVQNPDIMALLNVLRAFRTELALSDSSERVSSFMDAGVGELHRHSGSHR